MVGVRLRCSNWSCLHLLFTLECLLLIGVSSVNCESTTTSTPLTTLEKTTTAASQTTSTRKPTTTPVITTKSTTSATTASTTNATATSTVSTSVSTLPATTTPATTTPTTARPTTTPKPPYKRQDGYCVMYGQKALNPKFNNAYNGPAKAMSSEGFRLLKRVCPDLAKQHADNTYTCCDLAQLKTIGEQLKQADAMLRRCPSCSRNFNTLWCEMTCSPNQSKFYAYQDMGFSVQGHYFMSTDFVTDLFNSCKNVAFLGGRVFDLMCGANNAKTCTPQKLVDFLGLWEYQGGHSPFQIHMYIGEDPTKVPSKSGMPITEAKDSLTNINTRMIGCNETFTHGTRRKYACSCQDCPLSCTAPPPPPPLPHYAHIMGVPVFYFIVGLCLVFWIVLFLAFSTWQSIQLAKKAQEQKMDFPEKLPQSPSTYTMDDVNLCDIKIPSHKENYVKFSVKVEMYMQTQFRRWGTWCANNPLRVILGSLIVIIIASLGLTQMVIVTDPVDLWSAPSSEARIQKQYFDENFSPFYRNTQIIITSRTERPPDMHYLFSIHAIDDPPPTKFSGAVHKDILDEVLKLQLKVMDINTMYNGEKVTLKDICLQPLYPANKECAVFSVLQFWQLDQKTLDRCVNDYGSPCKRKRHKYMEEDWHDHMLACSRNPTDEKSGNTDTKTSCMSKFGAPMTNELIFGGYTDQVNQAEALLITIPLLNHNDVEQNGKAIAWEKELIKFLQQWEEKHSTDNSSNIKIAYTAESAIEAEIERVTKSDYSTMFLSYCLMFLYIAVSLGQYKSPTRILVDAKITVGIVGVLIVMMSVSAALGIGSYAGIKASLIIAEVIPFLVLAVGVDNIFILVQELQRNVRKDGESVPDHVGRVVGVVGPSMLLCSLSESVAFAFGALSSMPAVHTFAAMASLSVAVNFLLQITILVAVLSLDAQRQAANKLDLFYCFEIEKEDARSEAGSIFNDGILHYITNKLYAPFLLLNPVRVLVMIGFSIYLCCNICMIPNVDVGISQTVALPTDSYLNNYFGNMSKYLKTGAPVYFVVKEGLNYSDKAAQNQLCNSGGCNKNSLVASVFDKSRSSNYSKIALPPFSWIDDYLDWMDPSTPCCRILDFITYGNGTKKIPSTTTFCPSTAPKSWNCSHCINEDDAGLRPSPEKFRQFLPWFLNDNPNEKCAKAGHAAYGSAVKLNNVPYKKTDELLVKTSHFMAYHTVLTDSADFTEALRYAKELSANISEAIGEEVFPYSVFYVYYEQFLTTREHTWKNLLICVTAIFVVTFLLLGFNISSAACVTVTVCMIVVNLIGWMYMWDVSLNAVSLVNLVMSVGISVEFCSHVVRAFATSSKMTRVERAEDALARVGSSILSGITLTKFIGVFVLMFARTQLFVVYYFRMFTGIIVLGATHGIIFLPVLLSYVGPPRWKGTNTEESQPTSDDAVVIENYAVAGVKMSIVEEKSDIHHSQYEK